MLRIAAAALVLALPVAALAQQAPTGLVLSGDAGLLVMPDAGFDSGGSMSLTRWQTGFQAMQADPGGLSFGIGMRVGQSLYDFDGRNDLTGSIDVRELELSLPLRLRLSQSATGFVVPQFSYAGEEGVSLGDGDSSALLTGISWRLSPSLTLGPGVGVFGTLDNQVDVVPILLIDWKITPRWSLSNGPGIGATRGPGLQLGYEAGPRWSFALAARMEKNQFRLSDDSDVPGGIGTNTSVPVIASASWTPRPGTRISGFVGAAFDGEMSFKDAQGHKTGESGYDTAPLLGVVAKFGF